ncbi:MAG: sulfotransferase [Dinoroseobacter sp.]|nr:sulfotransferase [Dinoroseobacter sp.]
MFSGPDQDIPDTATMVFGIGAQKAGTTWLYETLRASPEVHFSPFKEVHYFDEIGKGIGPVQASRIALLQHFAQKLTGARGSERARALQTIRNLTAVLGIYTDPDPTHRAYRAFMAQGSAGQKFICDITPAYATLGRARFAQMAAIRQARFLFILRDPVSRMWSQIRMAVAARLGAQADTETFEAACRARALELAGTGQLPRVTRANYRRTITELEVAVPHDRIHYMFYETLFRQESADQMCAFLGIPPVAADPARRANPGRPSQMPGMVADTLRAGLAAQYTFISDRFGAEMPAAWRENHPEYA